MYVLRRKDVEKTILIDNFFPPTGRTKEREREREREKSEKEKRRWRAKRKRKRKVEERRRQKKKEKLSFAFHLRILSVCLLSFLSNFGRKKLLPIEENLSR